MCVMSACCMKRSSWCTCFMGKVVLTQLKKGAFFGELATMFATLT